MRKFNRSDHIEGVAEEITLYMGLKTKVVGDTTDGRIEREYIHVDTIAGVIKYNACCNDIMEEVYRFIYVYGAKLREYGLNKKIEEANRKEKPILS